MEGNFDSIHGITKAEIKKLRKKKKPKKKIKKSK